MARTFQNNVQYERGVRHQLCGDRRLRLRQGRQPAGVHRHQPDQPGRQLADGRPIYSTAVNAATRVDPRFNHIYSLESVGESTYKGLTLQFGRRWANNLQFDLTYTFGKGEDTAPMRNPSILTSLRSTPTIRVGSDQPRARQGSEPAGPAP